MDGKREPKESMVSTWLDDYNDLCVYLCIQMHKSLCTSIYFKFKQLSEKKKTMKEFSTKKDWILA